PKNAEAEFPEVCVSPKGAYEPWMLFRKPIDAKTVAENLRRWKTGALRRLSPDKPLPDAIPSGRTPKCEELISDHPCLKPQHFMRVIVRALLPLGEGNILDPFMGSDSTIAAAEAIGYKSSGLELDPEYFRLAGKAIPRLAALYPHFKGQEIEVEHFRVFRLFRGPNPVPRPFNDSTIQPFNGNGRGIGEAKIPQHPYAKWMWRAERRSGAKKEV